jgi:uncharacterized protein YndB with AHSA1/START domain
MLTKEMGSWWPATHHIAKTPFAEIVVEPRVGGRWFERDSDGGECDWGKVLVFDPPKRLIVSWHLQADWHYDPDVARASEVVFEFIAEGPEATRLEFEHRHLERHGEGWEQLRAGVDSPGGWTGILTAYEKSLAGEGASGAMSQQERDFAIAELEASRAAFLEATANLTVPQWEFRPAADRWSPAECAEHIGIIEDIVVRLVMPKALREPADRVRRTTLKMSDGAVLRTGRGRETKLNAPEPVQPSGRWKTPDEIVHNILAFRARTMDFVKTSQDDLRNHFADHPVFGTLDLYQWLLLVSAHMQRHTDQLSEVKRDSSFPKA